MPLDFEYEMDGRGERLLIEWFDHDAMRESFDPRQITAGLGQGKHFWDRSLAWNHGLDDLKWT